MNKLFLSIRHRFSRGSAPVVAVTSLSPAARSDSAADIRAGLLRQPGAAPPERAVREISAEDMRAHIIELSDDKYEGPRAR